MATEVAMLRHEVAATREDNNQLRDFIEDRLEERDRRLVETLRVMQERARQKQKSVLGGGSERKQYRYRVPESLFRDVLYFRSKLKCSKLNTHHPSDLV
jgi:hypothetical protein